MWSAYTLNTKCTYTTHYILNVVSSYTFLDVSDSMKKILSIDSLTYSKDCIGCNKDCPEDTGVIAWVFREDTKPSSVQVEGHMHHKL